MKNAGLTVEPKKKRWIITFEIYNVRGDAIPATKEVVAVSEQHARNIFVRENDNDGMTYRILLVTEAN